MAEFSGPAGASTDERLRAVGRGVGVAFGGYIVVQVIVLVGLSLVSAFGVAVTDPVVQYPVGTAIQFVGFLAATALVLAVLGRRDFLHLDWPDLRDAVAVVAGTLALVALQFAIIAALSALGIQGAQNQITKVGRENPQLMLYMIPLAIVFIGPGEELLFRGLVQGLLRESYAAAPAILMASALFAVVHLPALVVAPFESKVTTIVAITVLSLLLGALYEWTDNLVVPALVHGFYNAITFAFVYIGATGGA